MKESIEKLREMERSGKYVFHGSSEKVTGKFEPRQAYTVKDKIRIPDGSPAIFASQYLDYAIFMAVVSSKNCPKGLSSSCGNSGGVPVFRISALTHSQLGEKSDGYVYVFDKLLFTKRNNQEFISRDKISPLDEVSISWSDFDAVYTIGERFEDGDII